MKIDVRSKKLKMYFVKAIQQVDMKIAKIKPILITLKTTS